MENWPESKVDLKHLSIKITLSVVVMRGVADAHNSMIFRDLASSRQRCSYCQQETSKSSMCFTVTSSGSKSSSFLMQDFYGVFFTPRSDFLWSKCSQLRYQAYTSTGNG